jgi:hypothetical protein
MLYRHCVYSCLCDLTYFHFHSFHDATTVRATLLRSVGLTLPHPPSASPDDGNHIVAKDVQHLT